MTSTLSPSIVSLISVTSSGRSSISRISRWISGLFFRTDNATCFNRVVLPALGGETIIPRCPFPMGDSKSTIRIAVLVLPHSIRSRSSGKIGVISSKFVLRIAFMGSMPLILVRYNNALNFSCCVLIRVFPSRISPVFKLNLRICDGDTYTSFSPGR